LDIFRLFANVLTIQQMRNNVDGLASMRGEAVENHKEMETMVKVAINGFGRIGRKILRLALERKDIEIVAINDLSNSDTIAHLFKYDSVHGRVPAEVKLEGSLLRVGEKKIQLFSERQPELLPWKKHGVDIVYECTGIFTDKAKAGLHVQAGAKRVIISAPSKDADVTIVMGVNADTYDPSKHVVISNASCTTNCLAPLAKVVDDHFGIEKGVMLTVHSYTNDQQVLDLSHQDLRRARAAALSMIPTTTGAAKAVTLVMPHLKGKLDGLAIRVPTPNVSVVDFTGVVKKETNVGELNAALKAASEGPLKGILGFSTEPLVSIDYNGNPMSSTVDASLTSVMDGNLVKIISWYDNETGFSDRMLDLTSLMQKKGL
jgi:glyceraldehyde 3-phosphate dehydrogenase